MLNNFLMRFISQVLILLPTKLFRSLARFSCNRSIQSHPHKQLLVDVTNIIQYDHGTGIQRVVRALLVQLASNLPTGYVLKPVYATRKKAFRYAPIDFDRIQNTDYLKQNNYVHVSKGDIFLGLDLNANRLPFYLSQMLYWKLCGVKVNIVVYDLLPLHAPEWFQAATVKNFKRWIRVIAMISDQTLCISKSVKADLEQWMAVSYKLSSDILPAKVIPMGWDIAESNPSQGLPEDFNHLLTKLTQSKTALMVGTLEPRKGHQDILDAYDKIWMQGGDLNLVIVGRPGWKTEPLQNRIKTHSQYNQHLFWLNNASDEALEKIYGVVDGVIVASLAEGFGLPLLEALGNSKPVLARDLTVFREYQKNEISYFSDTSNLHVQIEEWLAAINTGYQYAKNNVPTLPTWRDSAKALVESL